MPVPPEHREFARRADDALMVDPMLIAARAREDWDAVAGIVDWLKAGL